MIRRGVPLGSIVLVVFNYFFYFDFDIGYKEFQGVDTLACALSVIALGHFGLLGGTWVEFDVGETVAKGWVCELVSLCDGQCIAGMQMVLIAFGRLAMDIAQEGSLDLVFNATLAPSEKGHFDYEFVSGVMSIDEISFSAELG